MNDRQNQINAIMTRVDDTLKTARLGFGDLTGGEQSRRMSGLRNLVVFGRSVTFTLQTLRGVISRAEFDAWYENEQEAMRGDPLMKLFHDLRNEILKEGRLRVLTSVTIKNLNFENLDSFGPRPPNAKAFVIGDRNGGSGWTIELPDGTEEMYYVDLPDALGEVEISQHFAAYGVGSVFEEKPESIEELSRAYLEKVEGIVARARAQFISKSRA